VIKKVMDSSTSASLAPSILSETMSVRHLAALAKVALCPKLVNKPVDVLASTESTWPKANHVFVLVASNQ